MSKSVPSAGQNAVGIIRAPSENDTITRDDEEPRTLLTKSSIENESTSDKWLADATATGTIENSDHMPKAWLARFGRTVASQAVDAIGGRMEGGGTTHVTLGGHSLAGAGGEDEEEAREAIRVLDALSTTEEPGTLEAMTGRDVLLGSSFQLSSGGKAGAPAWTAWGEVATGGFEAEVDDMRLDGDVTSAFLGAGVGAARWLAGVAVSLSEGDGSYALLENGEGGTVESTLTAVYPYAKLGLSDTVDVWRLVGLGQGELTLTHSRGTDAEQVFRPDIDMRTGLRLEARVRF